MNVIWTDEANAKLKKYIQRISFADFDAQKFENEFKAKVESFIERRFTRCQTYRYQNRSDLYRVAAFKRLVAVFAKKNDDAEIVTVLEAQEVRS